MIEYDRIIYDHLQPWMADLFIGRSFRDGLTSPRNSRQQGTLDLRKLR